METRPDIKTATERVRAVYNWFHKNGIFGKENENPTDEDFVEITWESIVSNIRNHCGELMKELLKDSDYTPKQIEKKAMELSTMLNDFYPKK